MTVLSSCLSRPIVDNHELIMRDGMVGVAHREYALVGQEVGRGVLRGALALIEDDLDPHAACVGVEQRGGDGCRGEAVRLDLNAGLGSTDGVGHQLCTVPAWGEAHGRPAGRCWLRGGRGRRHWRRGRRCGYTRLGGEAILIFGALVTAPLVAADVCIMVGGTTMEAMTGILMGHGAVHPASVQHTAQGEDTDGYADVDGWASPGWGASAADQMGCPA
jgi:hypothetical protein